MNRDPSNVASDDTPHLRNGLLRLVLRAQAIYYIVSGVWPLIHMESFIAVSGPKQDLWLVVTVGAILAAVGISIAVGAARRLPTVETATLAVGAAMVLTAVDIIYVSLGRIPPIYLADAAVEVLLIIGVVVGWLRLYGTVRPPQSLTSGTRHAHVVSETRR